MDTEQARAFFAGFTGQNGGKNGRLRAARDGADPVGFTCSHLVHNSLTAADNHRAQRLYDSTGAEKSGWLIYELQVSGPGPD